MTAQSIITVREIAEILSIKVATLYDYRWREKSGCPLFRQGRKLFAYRERFNEWYRQRLIYV